MCNYTIVVAEKVKSIKEFMKKKILEKLFHVIYISSWGFTSLKENPSGNCQYLHLALVSFPKDSPLSAAGDMVLGKMTQ